MPLRQLDRARRLLRRERHDAEPLFGQKGDPPFIFIQRRQRHRFHRATRQAQRRIAERKAPVALCGLQQQHPALCAQQQRAAIGAAHHLLRRRAQHQRRFGGLTVKRNKARRAVASNTPAPIALITDYQRGLAVP